MSKSGAGAGGGGLSESGRSSPVASEMEEGDDIREHSDERRRGWTC